MKQERSSVRRVALRSKPTRSRRPQPGQTGSKPLGATLVAVEERNWAMGVHLSALLGFVLPLGNVIGPLVVWLMKKNESTLVDAEGKEALNFQISMTIYMGISAIMIMVLIGIPLLFGFAAADLILTIIAAVKTSNGERYRYPITLRFLT
jgi:uncharacterized Tic20 family protein